LFGELPPVVIGTAHTPREGSRLRYAAYRLTEPFSDLWTCVCREGVERHEREGAVPRGRGLFTSNGIDVETFRPNPAVRRRKRLELGCDDGTSSGSRSGLSGRSKRTTPTCCEHLRVRRKAHRRGRGSSSPATEHC
jgi:hypothetical protein